ncbi:MAG: phosphotransferase [Candidatus Rhabdochlamydia sp.]
MNLKYKIHTLIFSLLLNAITFATAFSNKEISDFLELMNCKLPNVIDKCTDLNNQFSKVQLLENGGPSFINSVYLISLKNGEELIIKVGNPIWKGNKTQNEVSALKFLKANTTIPVPNVLAYENDVNQSLINNEYIIMPRIPGNPLNKEIDRIYKNKNIYYGILDQLAGFIVQLKNFQFPSIGNFRNYEGKDLEIGGIVDFANYEITDSCTSYSQYAWHSLNFYIKEMEVLLKKESQDSKLYEKYIPILRDFLATNDFRCLNEKKFFVFSHQDLVMKNILVNEDKITAILDWEWSGSALMENESMTGFDFLLAKEDKIYFANALENLGVSNFFDPPPVQRQLFYQLLGDIYTLVACREWKEGKLEHTAKFLNQKLEQRKIRNDPNFDIESFLLTVSQNIDQCILDFSNHSHN